MDTTDKNGITLEYLTERMREYNRQVAPGSECSAWQDYLADCVAIHKELPWDVPDLDASTMADYWIDVANGVSDDYDADTGALIR